MANVYGYPATHTLHIQGKEIPVIVDGTSIFGENESWSVEFLLKKRARLVRVERKA